MPAYFSLTKVGSTTPQNLQEIDDDMRRHFGAEADKERWYRSWYDIEGYGIAVGHGPQKLREILRDRDEIIDYLQSNFEWNAWYSR